MESKESEERPVERESLAEPGDLMPVSRAFVPDENMQTEIIVQGGPAPHIIQATPKLFSTLLSPDQRFPMPWLEALKFLLRCKRMGLDPFAGEVYISEKANDRGGRDFMMIIAQQAWRRLGAQHPDYAGIKYEDFPALTNTYSPPKYARATVYRKGCEPYVQEVHYDEACRVPKKEGGFYVKRGYAQVQPREFLRGVTEARAFRHAFPDRFSAVYAPGEEVSKESLTPSQMFGESND